MDESSGNGTGEEEIDLRVLGGKSIGTSDCLEIGGERMRVVKMIILCWLTIWMLSTAEIENPGGTEMVRDLLCLRCLWDTQMYSRW